MALATLRAERDALAREVGTLREAVQARSLAQMAKEREHGLQLRMVEDNAQRYLGAGEDQRRALVQRLEAERAENQRLHQELRRLTEDLAAAGKERQRAEQQSRAAEKYALEARIHVDRRVEEMLESQKREHQAELGRERAAHAEALQGAVPRAELAALLQSYADLWRSACSAHPGLHARRAECAVQELVRASSALAPDSELVQEPLRRALGGEAATGLGEALASHPRVSGGEAVLEGEGWAPRGDEAAVLRRHLPLRGRPPVLASENR